VPERGNELPAHATRRVNPRLDGR